MSYTPVNSDATNVAGYTIARLNATSPSTSAVTSDQAVAIADSYLGAIGGMGSTFMSDAFATGGLAYSTNAFNDVSVFTSWTTPSIPVAKTYWIWVRTCCYCTATGGVNFRITVDGSAPSGQPTSAQKLFLNVINQRFVWFFGVPVSLSTGTHVVKLQCNVDVGTTANFDGNDGRTFWITG
jgi:hypothetical protein